MQKLVQNVLKIFKNKIESKEIIETFNPLIYDNNLR